MQVNIMPCRHPLKDHEWPMRLKSGVIRHGDTAKFSQCVDKSDVHAFWGMRRPWGKEAIRQGRRSLIIERAYLGDRFKWHAFGLDGLNGFANFCTDDVPDDRWRKYWRDDMRDWKTGGEYALIVGQVPGDASLRGTDIFRWASSIIPQAKEIYGAVKFRPHPLSRIKNVNIAVDTDTGCLAESLKGAKVVITHSSNTAVDAVMAGVPAISMSRGSMAYAVTSHTLGESLYRGCRDDWGRRIAYSQWLPEEIESGEAWSHIRAQI